MLANFVCFFGHLQIILMLNFFFQKKYLSGPKVIHFFMLNSTEHDISNILKTKIPTKKEVSCFKSLRCYIYHANKC